MDNSDGTKGYTEVCGNKALFDEECLEKKDGVGRKEIERERWQLEQLPRERLLGGVEGRTGGRFAADARADATGGGAAEGTLLRRA